MRFPVGDWQFWVASLIVFGVVLVAVKPAMGLLFPKRFAKTKQVKTALTISAKRDA